MTRAADLTGQRFGQLVVIERAGANSGGNATWWCQCDCGNTTRTVGTDLRQGDSKTCGCAAAQRMHQRHEERRTDLTGQRFGRLVVIEYAGLNSYPRATWLCRCECGVEITVASHHLKDGETVSCGCRQREVMALRPTWLIKPIVGYVAAHSRVKYLHGSASTHSCVGCGKQAEDWSYDKQDPAQLIDPRGRPFSLDPTHYVPRCRSCHHVFDLTTPVVRAHPKKEQKQ